MYRDNTAMMLCPLHFRKGDVIMKKLETKLGWTAQVYLALAIISNLVLVICLIIETINGNVHIWTSLTITAVAAVTVWLNIQTCKGSRGAYWVFSAVAAAVALVHFAHGGLAIGFLTLLPIAIWRLVLHQGNFWQAMKQPAEGTQPAQSLT